MPKPMRLGKHTIAVKLSKDWNTLTPWSHWGENCKYIDVKKLKGSYYEILYLYFGPVGIIIGSLRTTQ